MSAIIIGEAAKQYGSNYSASKEIPSEFGAVIDMTKRLFPGCEIKAEIVDGAQFHESDYILVRVLWSALQLTNEQTSQSLTQWHEEVFDASPNLSAGTFRLQLEYPE